MGNDIENRICVFAMSKDDMTAIYDWFLSTYSEKFEYQTYGIFKLIKKNAMNISFTILTKNAPFYSELVELNKKYNNTLWIKNDWTDLDACIGNGIFLLLLTAIPIFLYYKNEYILLAFLKLRKQDFAGAKVWLDKIKNPETALVRKQQGYFNYLHGLMLSQTNLTQAEKYFKKAIELGLNMDMDLAVAKLNLAGVAMSRRRKLEATNLLNEAKKLDKQGMLKDQIKMMKEQMKKI
jgi:tetratricopeptide (TPR) repeat protein